MQHNIILYNNTSEQNRLDKTNYLTKLQEVEGELRSDTHILSPVIDIYLLHQNVSVEAYQVNYIYIPDFGRYYFVTSFDVCNGEIEHISSTTIKQNVLIRFYLQVDVLMSWKDGIKKLECFITRQEVVSNQLYIDTKRPFLNKSTVTFIEDTVSTSELFPFDKTGNIPRDEYGRTFCYIINVSNNFIKPVHGTNITPFNDYYVSDAEGISKLATYLYKTFVGFFEKPSEGFISLHYYPFRIDNIIKKDSTYTETSILHVGDKTFDNEVTPKTYLSPADKFTMGMYRVNAGYVHIPFIRYFYQLSPFTTYELYVPYVGWITLSNDIICDCSNEDIFVSYYVNFTNHEVNYVISKSTNDLNKAYLIGNCNMGCEIPLSSSNYNEIIKNVILTTMGAVIKTGTSIANYNSVNQGFDKMSDKRTNKYKTQKNIMKTQQTGELINSVTDYGVNMAINTQEKISSIGELSGSYSYIRFSNKPILKITSTTPANIDLAKYGKFVGFPYIGSETISNISGYTEVGSVHVENIGCLETERDEIESILKSGFIA